MFPSALRRYHGTMYSLRKSGYDPDAMRAVAVAYRRECQTGQPRGSDCRTRF